MQFGPHGSDCRCGLINKIFPNREALFLNHGAVPPNGRLIGITSVQLHAGDGSRHLLSRLIHLSDPRF
jgi:hypothetical protein